MPRNTEAANSQFAGLTERLMRKMQEHDIAAITVFAADNKSSSLTLTDRGTWLRWIFNHPALLSNFTFQRLMVEYATATDKDYIQLLSDELDDSFRFAEQYDETTLSEDELFSGIMNDPEIAKVMAIYEKKRMTYLDQHWERLSAAVLGILSELLARDANELATK